MAEQVELREEWSVAHAQGIHPGSFTREAAEQWIADDRVRDARRQRQARGRQRLLRRFVSEWEEVAAPVPHPAVTDVGEGGGS